MIDETRKYRVDFSRCLAERLELASSLGNARGLLF